MHQNYNSGCTSGPVIHIRDQQNVAQEWGSPLLLFLLPELNKSNKESNQVMAMDLKICAQIASTI
jgi:hypothetical protein